MDSSTEKAQARDYSRATKRQKLDNQESETESETDSETNSETESEQSVNNGQSQTPSISPPPLRAAKAVLASADTVARAAEVVESQARPATSRLISSPIQLTHIRDMSASYNVDSISLGDILGDPLIKECWQFNFLFDVDFIMRHLDADVRHSVKVKVVHGSWKREDSHRISLEEAATRWPNVELVTAHMPEVFGTHHSKMMILIRHDDTAQVIIHTSNMIRQDWTNMCQAVWRSPLLPLLPAKSGKIEDGNLRHPIGSGRRFKADLLHYLCAYRGRLRSLIEQLDKYDFSSIRAAFIASTPSKQSVASPFSQHTPWGWSGLKHILASLPPRSATTSSPCINIQVSSIATLTEKWIESFFDVLSTTPSGTGSLLSNFFNQANGQNVARPTALVIFPTADEVRKSLDGYQSGSSIHMKLQSVAQQKQWTIMRPLFRHWWAEVSGSGTTTESPAMPIREAGRRQSAPHIKTYIRFSDAACTSIDWAMLTSANLSTQAWGALPNKDGDVRICSYETGVVLWPGLYDMEGGKAVMVPTFQSDTPDERHVAGISKGASALHKRNLGLDGVVVGFRMPYDLPLVPYGQDDVPWCATAAHSIPDTKGFAWGGYQPQA